MRGRREVTDAQWARLQPLLAPKRRTGGHGRPWQDTRQVLNGVLGTGAQWCELPIRYPPYQTCHRTRSSFLISFDEHCRVEQVSDIAGND